MATQNKRQQAQQKTDVQQYRCRDCSHSYDFRSPAVDGHLTMCRCPFNGKGGQYYILTAGRACEHFEKREKA